MSVCAKLHSDRVGLTSWDFSLLLQSLSVTNKRLSLTWIRVSENIPKFPRFSPDETAVLWVKVLQGFVLKNVQHLIKHLFLLVVSCVKIYPDFRAGWCSVCKFRNWAVSLQGLIQFQESEHCLSQSGYLSKRYILHSRKLQPRQISGVKTVQRQNNNNMMFSLFCIQQ